VVTLLSYTGNRYMGPTITSSISCTTPMFALSGAILFLGEALTAGNVLGTITIVLGMLALTWTAARVRATGAVGDCVALAGAAIRALAQVLTRAGLALWGSPYAASLIGYTVSAAVILIVASSSGHASDRPAARYPGHRTGVFNPQQCIPDGTSPWTRAGDLVSPCRDLSLVHGSPEHGLPAARPHHAAVAVGRADGGRGGGVLGVLSS